MSALSIPAWGRASGRFSTFTARAGRSGTWRCTPVRGAVGGGFEAGWPVMAPPSFRKGSGPLPVSARTADSARMPAAAPPIPATIFPRLVKAKSRDLLTGELGFLRLERADGTHGYGPPQTPRPIDRGIPDKLFTSPP